MWIYFVYGPLSVEAKCEGQKAFTNDLCRKLSFSFLGRCFEKTWFFSDKELPNCERYFTAECCRFVNLSSIFRSCLNFARFTIARISFFKRHYMTFYLIFKEKLEIE